MTDFERQVIDALSRLRKQVSRIETREQGVYCRWRGSSATAPSPASDGDLWNDTTSGNTIKIYANSGWRSLN